jgi:hypothetical protein
MVTLITHSACTQPRAHSTRRLNLSEQTEVIVVEGEPNAAPDEHLALHEAERAHADERHAGCEAAHAEHRARLDALEMRTEWTEDSAHAAQATANEAVETAAEVAAEAVEVAAVVAEAVAEETAAEAVEEAAEEQAAVTGEVAAEIATEIPPDVTDQQIDQAVKRNRPWWQKGI